MREQKMSSYEGTGGQPRHSLRLAVSESGLPWREKLRLTETTAESLQPCKTSEMHEDQHRVCTIRVGGALSVLTLG